MTMIVLVGTAGAGKSSLTVLTTNRLGSETFYESVDDSEVLPLFYTEPEKYASSLQIYFLDKRFDSIRQALTHENNVLDCSIYEDSLLFRLDADLGHANETEVRVYDDLLQNMLQELPYAAYKKKSDLLVYIRISFPKILERIKKRGHPYEQIETDPVLYDYYQMLNERYNQWYKDYDGNPKIQIDGDKCDFVEDLETCQYVLALIEKKIEKSER